MHGRSGMTIVPRIPTMPGRSMRIHIVACLSRLTIDHASLPRRSIVPTPNRDTSKIFGCSFRRSHLLHGNVLTILSPSYFATRGHRLSPRISRRWGGGGGLRQSNRVHILTLAVSHALEREEIKTAVGLLLCSSVLRLGTASTTWLMCHNFSLHQRFLFRELSRAVRFR